MKGTLKKLSSVLKRRRRKERAEQEYVDQPVTEQGFTNVQGQAASSGSRSHIHQIQGKTVKARKESGLEISGSVAHGIYVLYPPTELSNTNNSQVAE